MKFSLLQLAFVVICFQLIRSDRSGIEYGGPAEEWVPILKKLLDSGHVSAAGIYNVRWASTPDVNVYETDFRRIVDSLKKPAKFQKIYIGDGEKPYKIITADSNSFQAELDDGKGIFGFVSPKETVLIGKYDIGMDAGEALNVLKEAQASIEALEME